MLIVYNKQELENNTYIFLPNDRRLNSAQGVQILCHSLYQGSDKWHNLLTFKEHFNSTFQIKSARRSVTLLLFKFCSNGSLPCGIASLSHSILSHTTLTSIFHHIVISFPVLLRSQTLPYAGKNISAGNNKTNQDIRKGFWGLFTVTTDLAVNKKKPISSIHHNHDHHLGFS